MNERTGFGPYNVCGGSGCVCEITPVDLGNTTTAEPVPCVCNPKALVKWTKVLAEVQRNTEGSQEIAS